jgi:hypothetical protein
MTVLEQATVLDHEFNNALYMAHEAGQLDLLRRYLSTGKPIPQYVVYLDRPRIRMPVDVYVADLLGRGPPRLNNGAGPGRPRRVASKASAIEQAERNAACLVAQKQKHWRERQRRERVPADVTNQMIIEASGVVAKTFRVSLDTISAGNIRNLLKNGSIVVP